MRRSLMVFLAVLLVSLMVLGGAAAFSSRGSEEGNHQPSIPAEVWQNSAKLLEVSERLVLADLAAKGIPLAGFYVDAQTCTIYVGLTEIKDEYTAPIKAIVNEVEGIKLEFVKAKFTEAELRSLQIQIAQVFLGITSADMEKLDAIEDEVRKDNMRKEFRERTERRKAEHGIPLTLLGVDIKNNGLMVGLKEIKPQYVEAIRQVVGTEVPIEFKQGEAELDSTTKTCMHRPMLVGGIQITSEATSTLGFRATRTDGTVGFVMTGHAGWVGTRVDQPSHGHQVGTISVNPPGSRSSDAAFVPTTNINPTVWPSRSIVGWWSSSFTPHGTAVRMEGITSCGTSGVVRSIDVMVNHPTFGTLFGQVLATYTSAPGDSGAPTFGVDGAGNAIIFGIHWGRWGNLAVYSPVQGVRGDLGLRWGS